ncbi:MAG: serine hydrolase [Phormidesmis sp.]
MSEFVDTNTPTPAVSTAAAQLPTHKITEIETYLTAHQETGRFSGNVMLRKNQQTIFQKSFGLANLEHGVPNHLETKFRIGSITKQFTAAAILQLQDQGLLTLTSPVSTYLTAYPEGDRITLQQLLTHTAGIPGYLDPDVFPDAAEWLRLPSTPAQMVERIGSRPLKFEPGTQFKYSNSGYILLSHILEVVSQQPYATYLTENIFTPLNMESTGYEMPQLVIPNLAQGYAYYGDYFQATPIDMSLPLGAGGLYSTLADLARWNAWLHSDPTTQTLLSEEAIARLKTPVVSMTKQAETTDSNPETAPTYGYGLIHDHHLQQPRIYHNGGIPGFSSMLSHYPETTLTVAVLTNLENAAAERIANGLAAIAFSEPYDLPTQLVAIDLDPTLYKKYEGTYQLLPQLQITLRIENNQLIAQATGQPAFILSPSSETDFFEENYDISITFSFTENDTINGFTFRQMGQELFAQRLL